MRKLAVGGSGAEPVIASPCQALSAATIAASAHVARRRCSRDEREPTSNVAVRQLV